MWPRPKSRILEATSSPANLSQAALTTYQLSLPFKKIYFLICLPQNNFAYFQSLCMYIKSHNKRPLVCSFFTQQIHAHLCTRWKSVHFHCFLLLLLGFVEEKLCNVLWKPGKEALIQAITIGSETAIMGFFSREAGYQSRFWIQHWQLEIYSQGIGEDCR